MDFNFTIRLTASAELLAAINNLAGRVFKSAAPANNPSGLPPVPAELPQSAPAKEPVQKPAAAVADAPASDTDTPAVTLEEIRAYVKNHPAIRAQAKAALTEFGASKLTDLAEENFTEYFNKIQSYA